MSGKWHSPEVGHSSSSKSKNKQKNFKLYNYMNGDQNETVDNIEIRTSISMKKKESSVFAGDGVPKVTSESSVCEDLELGKRRNKKRKVKPLPVDEGNFQEEALQYEEQDESAVTEKRKEKKRKERIPSVVEEFIQEVVEEGDGLIPKKRKKKIKKNISCGDQEHHQEEDDLNCFFSTSETRKRNKKQTSTVEEECKEGDEFQDLTVTQANENNEQDSDQDHYVDRSKLSESLVVKRNTKRKQRYMLDQSKLGSSQTDIRHLVEEQNQKPGATLKKKKKEKLMCFSVVDNVIPNPSLLDDSSRAEEEEESHRPVSKTVKKKKKLMGLFFMDDFQTEVPNPILLDGTSSAGKQNESHGTVINSPPLDPNITRRKRKRTLSNKEGEVNPNKNANVESPLVKKENKKRRIIVDNTNHISDPREHSLTHTEGMDRQARDVAGSDGVSAKAKNSDVENDLVEEIHNGDVMEEEHSESVHVEEQFPRCPDSSVEKTDQSMESSVNWRNGNVDSQDAVNKDVNDKVEKSPLVQKKSPNEESPSMQKNSRNEGTPSMQEESPNEESPSVQKKSRNEGTPSMQRKIPSEESLLMQKKGPNEKSPSVQKESRNEGTPSMQEESPNEESPSVQKKVPNEKSLLIQKKGPNEGTPSMKKKSPNEESPSVQKNVPNEKSLLIQKKGPLQKKSRNEGTPSMQKKSPNGKSLLIQKKGPNDESPSVQKKSRNEGTPSMKKKSPNEESPSVQKNVPNEKFLLIQKKGPNDESPSVQKKSRNEGTPSMQEESPNEESPSVQKKVPNEKSLLIQKKGPNEESPSVRKKGPSEKSPSVQKKSRNEGTPSMQEESPNEESPSVQKKVTNEKSLLIQNKGPNEEFPSVLKKSRNERTPSVQKKSQNEESLSIQKKDSNERSSSMQKESPKVIHDNEQRGNVLSTSMFSVSLIEPKAELSLSTNAFSVDTPRSHPKESKRKLIEDLHSQTDSQKEEESFEEKPSVDFLFESLVTIHADPDSIERDADNQALFSEESLEQSVRYDAVVKSEPFDEELGTAEVLGSNLSEEDATNPEWELRNKGDVTCPQTQAQAEEIFECLFCPKKFSQAKYLKRHLLTHTPTSERSLTCKVCDKQYLSRRRFILHQETHTTKNFKCEECEETFFHRSHLISHASVAHGIAAMKCDRCDLQFLSKKAFNGHLTTHVEKKHACTICFKTFSYYTHLNEHMASHEQKKSHTYPCELCPKTYKSRQNLHDHLRSHGERNWECTQCDKKFYLVRQLQSHMVIHVEQRPYECRTCGKTFKRKADRRSHKWFHRKDQMSQIKEHERRQLTPVAAKLVLKEGFKDVKKQLTEVALNAVPVSDDALLKRRSGRSDREPGELFKEKNVKSSAVGKDIDTAYVVRKNGKGVHYRCSKCRKVYSGSDESLCQRCLLRKSKLSLPQHGED